MIIFGMTSLKHVKEKGTFYCPQCSDHKDYKLREPRRWFHLYFIPVIPLDNLGRYVECKQCKGTFVEQVLQHDPVADHNRFIGEVERATRWVTLKMALADGAATDDELIEISLLLKSLINRDVSVQELKEQVAQVAGDQRSVEDYMHAVVGMLNGTGKAQVMRGLLAVALADGNFDREERAFAKRCGDALLLDPAHTRGLIAEAEDHARREQAA
ncbi:TerB family tellurite resistance protein [Terricaulis sp.]|uniref:TerB family tellurite resistance protein n=1 Tax=Terricaulis sp. TaxID=2768686 RepID=UPI0037830C4F